MHYPELTPIPARRETVEVFRGLNRTDRPGAGEFRDMENLTSDHYPVLSPRSPRAVYAEAASPQGLIAKDCLCYVDGEDFVLGEQRLPLGLSTAGEHCPKQLISMGAYVVILPDRLYVNTADPTDCGSLDNTVTTREEATLEPCRSDGTLLKGWVNGETAPEDPKEGDLWLPAGETGLKQWSSATGAWVGPISTFVKLTAPGIGQGFSRDDGVVITVPEGADTSLNGANILTDVTEDSITVTGLVPMGTVLPPGVKVERRMPEVDFLTEAGNRLWGCRYGSDEHGEFVNRLYACALGDFKNWNRFQGLSTDSYFANVGTDGPFTGAVTYLGRPLFFKENGMHKVYGSYPSEFAVQDTACRGVQPGSHRSLAIVGEVLYYLSRSGVCGYDGGLPMEVSRNLRLEGWGSGVAGTAAGKYYLSLTDPEGASHLLVYDTHRSLWHREDGLRALDFATCRGKLYAIDGKSRNILCLRGQPGEETVSWMAQTGELGLGSPDRKYISRLTLRLQLDPSAQLKVWGEYDLCGTWELLAVIRGSTLRGFAVPIRPRRCDFLRLKFQGTGPGKLYSLTKTVEGGSDIQW